MRAALLFALCACGSRSDLSEPASVSSVSPQTITITQGGSPVDIAIHVANAFADEVRVDIPSLPLELSATSTTIPAGVSDATISIRATREAEQGPAGPIEVRAITKHGEQHFPLDVFVRGCPGCLDNTYANNGVARLPHGVYLLAVDASDRVTVVGMTSATTSSVSRVHADGTLDPSFAEIASPNLWRAIALDASGGAYLAGIDGQTTPHGVVAHVTSSGALDMSFTFPTANTTFNSVAIASDGAVLASGSRAFADAILVKVRQSGELDTSFGDAGVVQVVGDSTGSVACDGALVLLTTEVAVRRFNPSGAADETFGNGGVVPLTPYLTGGFVIGDRYVVVGGSTVTMLTRDGSVDPSFGEGGAAVAKVALYDSASLGRWVAVEPDGKLVVSGQVFWGEANEGTYVVRLNRDGTLDAPFATKGVLLSVANPPATALLSDGRILVGGTMPWWGDPNNTWGFLERYWN